MSFRPGTLCRVQAAGGAAGLQAEDDRVAQVIYGILGGTCHDPGELAPGQLRTPGTSNFSAWRRTVQQVRASPHRTAVCGIGTDEDVALLSSVGGCAIASAAAFPARAADVTGVLLFDAVAVTPARSSSAPTTRLC